MCVSVGQLSRSTEKGKSGGRAITRTGGRHCGIWKICPKLCVGVRIIRKFVWRDIICEKFKEPYPTFQTCVWRKIPRNWNAHLFPFVGRSNWDVKLQNPIIHRHTTALVVQKIKTRQTDRHWLERGEGGQFKEIWTEKFKKISHSSPSLLSLSLSLSYYSNKIHSNFVEQSSPLLTFFQCFWTLLFLKGSWPVRRRKGQKWN